MKQSEAEQIIRKELPAALLEEVIYRMDIYNDEDEEYRDGQTMSLIEAFLDRVNLSEDISLEQTVDAKFRRQAKKEYLAYQRVLIKIGFYILVTQEEIDNTYVCGGRGKMMLFPKIDGVRYQSTHSYESFVKSFEE